MLRSFQALLLLTMTAGTSLAQSSRSANPQAPQVAASDRMQQDDIAALKTDLQRMRTTLYQMQTNLAFVGNTTTPLYHEFELDIQMWQTMLAQMQRRVDRLEKTRQRAAEKQ